MKKFYLTTLFSVFCVSSSMASYHNLCITADLDTLSKKNISMAIDTRDATQACVGSSNTSRLYWLDRKKDSSYHVTLEIMTPKKAKFFSQADATTLQTILGNYKKFAKNLNASKNHNYSANGYDLIMFVRHTDGTATEYNAQTINGLIEGKDITMAHLVVRIGTQGLLRDDWNHTSKNILFNPQKSYAATFNRLANTDLETHVTIASLFAYDAKKYGVVNGKVQDLANSSAKVYNTPFTAFDKKVLVDLFNKTNNKSKLPLNGMVIDQFSVSGKDQNSKVQTISTVKL